MSAFNSQDYVNRFGSALSAAAEGNRPDVSGDGQDDQSGSADPEGGALGGYDPDQEQSLARTQSESKNVAPMPNQRQMFYGSPPPPAGAKGGALGAGGTPSFSHSAQDPQQEAANSAHAASMKTLSDDDLKQYRDYVEGHLANTGLEHGETGKPMDFEALYQHTFHAKLAEHSAMADMTEAQAKKFQNPTWRDKIGMFLDAQNRASIIHAQNPQLSPGDIWALSTRNALQGWAANAQGAHDAYVKQAGALQAQAQSDAQAAVKRQMDQANYGDLVSKARKANSEAALKEADLPSEPRMREAEINEKNSAASEKRAQGTKAANDKGTLVTVKNEDGSESTGYIDQKSNVFTPAKDASGKPIGGQVQKTGTDKQTPPIDDKLMTQAREAYQAEVKNITGNVRNRKMTPQQVAQSALENLKTISPTLYKAFTQQPDQPAAKPSPGKPAQAANAGPPKRSWEQ